MYVDQIAARQSPTRAVPPLIAIHYCMYAMSTTYMELLGISYVSHGYHVYDRPLGTPLQVPRAGKPSRASIKDNYLGYLLYYSVDRSIHWYEEILAGG